MPLLSKIARTFLPSFVTQKLGLESEQDKNQHKTETLFTDFIESYYDQLINFANNTQGSVEKGLESYIDKVVYQSTDALPIESAAYVDVETGQTYPLVGDFAKLAYPYQPERQNRDIIAEKVVATFMDQMQDSLNNLKRDLKDKAKAEEQLAAKARQRAKAPNKNTDDYSEEEEQLKRDLVVNASENKLLAATLHTIKSLVALGNLAKEIHTWSTVQKANPDKKHDSIESKTKEFTKLAREARLFLRGLGDFYPDQKDNLRKMAISLSDIELKLITSVPEIKSEAVSARRATV